MVLTATMDARRRALRGGSWALSPDRSCHFWLADWFLTRIPVFRKSSHGEAGATVDEWLPPASSFTVETGLSVDRAARSGQTAGMKRIMAPLVALGLLSAASAVHASLPMGATAPEFTTKGAKAGKEITFDLKEALKRGPVVLYFYPKAFTQGCTLEAHAFAEATPEFAELGATVIGMSADDLPTLKKFSTEECRDKFAVAVATPKIIKDYDVALIRKGAPEGMTDRVSYVIDQNGKVVFIHSDLDYRDHVKMTLAAVKVLRAKRP
jgi:peroxiredoxin